MPGHTFRYAVNLSILFTELDLLDRPAAAKAAGFDAVEFWWPFSTATPPATEVNAFVTAITEADVQLVGLNFFAGDLAAGERGVASLPRRIDEFKAGVDHAVEIGRVLHCPAFNALYGNRVDAASATEQDAVAVGALRYAATAAEDIGATVLLEPVSGIPSYPLRTAADVITVLDNVGAPNIGLLADLYHLTVNGDDVAEVIENHTGRIAHVQVADAPGRGEPGSGDLPLENWLDALAANGYAGYVAAEYKPTVPSADSFGWLPLRREYRADPR